MNLILWLRKIAIKILGKKNSILSYDVDKQMRYMNRLNEPKDDIDRSFNQYRCQMKLYGSAYKVLINLVAPSLIISLVVIYWLSNAYAQQKKNVDNNLTAVFFANSLPDSYIPAELSKRYNNIIKAEVNGRGYLTNEDLFFLSTIIRRYPLSWYFIFKVLIKVGAYSRQIYFCGPKAIIVSAEYSFTSSIMTKYCNERGIFHINIQHGEKMLYMEDSFFRFDECYVWDDRYKNILILLKAEPTQFRIITPPILGEMKERVMSHRKDSMVIYDIKYYLSNETKYELGSIKKTLEAVVERGMSVCIRPHPAQTEIKLVDKMFGEYFYVENPRHVSIEESLAGCNIAVSVRSFVLQQAYYAGIKTAIDDISMPDYYKTLTEIGYIMIKKSEKLSLVVSNKI